ncbi:cytochrome P450 6B2-like [Bombyx mandarina]|uniref:unspecific monooxygenase n=1 Tax=Bombyx mandarina TaxID=7092 RepID=A0A6J2JAW0_BOMMA|nr:cytochrome P450 6B2-like [Bombyx mandarina]
MLTAAIFVIIVALVYLYSTRTFRYWEKRGIKHDKPMPFFGTDSEGYLLRKSITQTAVDAYLKYPNEKVVGFFRSSRPELIIRDPDIIKQILTTDFAYFYPRGLKPHKKVIQPLMRNLFFADGDLWRLLRQRMTPAFTSGKLRAMFPLVVERAERLQARTLKIASQPLDARELMARYTTDFIGACGFGLDADSLNDEDSAFRKLGAAIFNITVQRAIVAVLKQIFPRLFKHFKYSSKYETDFVSLVSSILKQRNYKPSGRNDFIDLLLECQMKGEIVVESIEKMKPDGTPEIIRMVLTEQLLAAQVFVFFAAGFETSSSATSFTLHQLAFHPEIQEKVQKELDQVLAKYNNKLCYDAIKEMRYLESAFKEAMRMFPSLGYLIRECARQYTFPELNLTIDEGVGIIIPLQALHNDPEYFDSPNEFRPERFMPSEYNHNKTKFVYLPFGDGPRRCIGARLGLMQSLAGLAAVLSKFTVKPAPSTKRHPVVEPKSSVVQSIKDGLPLLFIERTKS